MEGAIECRVVRRFGDVSGCVTQDEVTTCAATGLTDRQVGCVGVDMQDPPASVVANFRVRISGHVV